MSAAGKKADTARDAEIVRVYLETHMIPDPVAAAKYVGSDFTLTFTGGRKFDSPTGATGFNARRYKWVKKKMDRFETVPGENETIVYSLGTLYGEWPDGTPFEGNRYVDRFVVRDGLIVAQDVWNDSAERLLTKNGIEA
ncbi:MAG: nuclear transport factor 2 family protein [Xanthobacteraceae bacterium]|uniref:nuclear transport factor 2 family protein n=1 Tax=Pseudolabrys sp. TaxID=1960880 RepID=UPI003D09BDDE